MEKSYRGFIESILPSQELNKQILRNNINEIVIQLFIPLYNAYNLNLIITTELINQTEILRERIRESINSSQIIQDRKNRWFNQYKEDNKQYMNSVLRFTIYDIGANYKFLDILEDIFKNTIDRVPTTFVKELFLPVRTMNGGRIKPPIYYISDSLKQKIIQEYDTAGYIYTYFGFLIKTESRVMSYMKRKGVILPGAENISTEPTKQIYETQSEIITMKSYGTFLDKLTTTFGTDAFYAMKDDIYSEGYLNMTIPGQIGWSKKDIVNAIISSGLLEKVGPKRTRLDDVLDLPETINIEVSLQHRISIWYDISQRLSSYTREHYPNLPTTSKTLRRKPTMPGFGTNPQIERVQRGREFYMRNKPQKLAEYDRRAFYRTYYMPKLYYEMIYRKIFSTLTWVNWKQVCLNNLLTLQSLKIVAKSLSIPFRENEDANTICQRIEAASATERTLPPSQMTTRRQIRRGLVSEIPELAPAILLQPGGRNALQQAQSLSRFAPISPVEEELPLIQQEINNLCLIPSTQEEKYKQILNLF